MNPVIEAMAGVAALPTELRKAHLLDGQQTCSVDLCESGALITLGKKPLCLNHFIERCYEWLDYLEPLIHGRAFVQTERNRAQSIVEECSNQALLVSLRCEDLTNLDRSRLLDILLLTSDLLFQLRVPRNEFPTLFADGTKLRAGKPHYKVPNAKSACL
jgi:hypothetical protein